MRLSHVLVFIFCNLWYYTYAGDFHSADQPPSISANRAEYIAKGKYFLDFDLDSAQFYADLALNYPGPIPDSTSIEIYRIYLFVNYYRGDYENCIKTAQKLRELTDENDAKSLSAAFNNLGLMHMLHGEYATAKTYYDSAISALPKGKESVPGRIDLLNNLGILEKNRGNFDGAIQHFFDALELIDVNNDPENEVYIYQNLADNFFIIEDLDNALKYAQKAFELKQHLNMENTLGTTLALMGDIYAARGIEDSAKTYYQHAIENYRNLGNKPGEGSIFHSLAGMAYNNNDFETALTLALTAEELKKEGSSRTEYLNTKYLLALIHLKLNRYLTAQKELDFVEAQTTSTDDPILLHEVYRHQSIIKEISGNHALALDYERKAHNLSRQLLNDEKINSIAEMEAKFDTKLKEAEINALLIENQLTEASLNKQKLLLIVFAIAGILLILISVSLYLLVRHRKKLHRRDKLLHEAEITLTALKSMMDGEEKERMRIARDLHDSLSAQLSAVKMKLSVLEYQSPQLKSDDNFKTALRTLDRAAHEVRQIAHNMAPQELSNYGLTEALGLFIENLDGFNGTRIHYSHRGFGEQVNKKLERDLFLIAQEVIHNSLKHAGAKDILVSLIKTDSGIDLTIKDNGCGFEVNKSTNLGMGLSNIRNRVQRWNGKLNITAQPTKGTAVKIEILSQMEYAL